MDLIIGIAVALVVGMVIGNAIARRVYVCLAVELLQELGVTDKALMALSKKLQERYKVNSQLIAAMSKDEAEPIDHEQIPMEVELHDGQLYAYRIDTHQFLAQAATAPALIEAIQGNSDYKNFEFCVAQEHGALLLTPVD